MGTIKVHGFQCPVKANQDLPVSIDVSTKDSWMIRKIGKLNVKLEATDHRSGKSGETLRFLAGSNGADGSLGGDDDKVLDQLRDAVDMLRDKNPDSVEWAPPS